MTGPYFEDLGAGTCLPAESGMTLDSGHAAVYRALSGDASPVYLDREYARSMGIDGPPLVNPGLVAHVSIGQSSVATANVVANLFYRRLVHWRPVAIGETIRTDVEVVAAREATPRADREPRGKVLLRSRARNSQGEIVLEYERCALVRKRAAEDTGRRDGTGRIDPVVELSGADRWPWTPPAFTGPGWRVGEPRTDPVREPVTEELALVRLTGNLAAAHRDPRFGQAGRRLVYGGHAIALAQAALARLTPGLITILGWHGCEHLGPVFAGDLLEFTATPVQGAGAAVHFQVTGAVVGAGSPPRTVLSWQPIVLVRPGAVTPG
ncbi:MAG TPA: MaoC family dehydratase [Mycobacteriales bacterium]|nr:MaoC family dehydratase [Mycobacteriales bacterium]